MRLISLIFSFVLTASLATVALAYVSERVGQNRIEVQDGWISSSEPPAYQAYGQAISTEPDTIVNSRAEKDSTGGH